MAPATRAQPANDRRPSRWVLAAMIFAAVLIFLYYWMLLTDGKFLDIAPHQNGLVFNSMLDHLLHGGFDVDRSVIQSEGFTRDGRTYAYFGVVPALLRLPLMWLPPFMTLDFTAVFCAVAATVAATGHDVAEAPVDGHAVPAGALSE